MDIQVTFKGYANEDLQSFKGIKWVPTTGDIAKSLLTDFAKSEIKSFVKTALAKGQVKIGNDNEEKRIPKNTSDQELDDILATIRYCNKIIIEKQR